MVVTAYDPGSRSTGWKYHHGLTVYTYGRRRGKAKRVGITSDGSKAKVGTIAADISIYPYGTRMFVPGYGWGEVHDVGQAIKGDHIDIFFNTESEALAWGRKNLKVTVIRPDTTSAEYRRNLERKLEIAADLRKRLSALAREQNCRERDLLAEAVEDLLKKYEKNGGKPRAQSAKAGKK
jgi:3D (Asp-Asp-Asp) domain-containing protein